ncbi:hypothetical protein SAMN05216319_0261 [Duganella sp. CF402]|uniref:hypothetical protein n=1 Tax=unclassified Duganella TaxID=2636909 RepID=UPI0008D643CE|nr:MULTISPECIES: hypothetical protein [unclassified Duganella]RZT11258.1 hypothetical protein EV582_3365 [Duganella sp. BK701]SEK73907.1 hypothetical protein SAMN05216319_0261 [Duganella sp. CF402]
MKSTIKNTYQRRVAADGTITLAYRTHVFNAHHAGLIGLLVFAVIGLFCAMTSLSVLILSPVVSKQSTAGAIFSLIFGLTSTALITRHLLARTYTLVLTPEGMIFPRFAYGPMTSQLPYADIANLGFKKKTANHNGQYFETCHVYAYAGGTEVKLTRDIPQSLADAILQEINQQLARLAA